MAPLFSVEIPRLHRHIAIHNHELELILPMEGAALSSEGMLAFQTAFAPCHNRSGIWTWNQDPSGLSDLFLKRKIWEI